MSTASEVWKTWRYEVRGPKVSTATTLCEWLRVVERNLLQTLQATMRSMHLSTKHGL